MSRRRADLARQRREAWLAVRLWVGLVIVGVALGIVAWVVVSALEAAAYRRLTGQEVTTWDAMWVQLRVEGGAR